MIVKAQPGDGPAQQLSFVSVLALARALDNWVAFDRLALKWPNDLMLSHVKCAGILLEGQGSATIIGFGVNLAAHPDDSERPATSLAAAGLPPPGAAEVAARLALTFAATRAEWQAGGFGPIREAWLARAAGLGQPLVARLGSETVAGIFAGLADDGALQLRLDNGSIRAIHAGEVFAGV